MEWEQPTLEQQGAAATKQAKGCSETSQKDMEEASNMGEGVCEMALEAFEIPTQSPAQEQGEEEGSSEGPFCEPKKREDNTTLRLVMTAMRNHLKRSGLPSAEVKRLRRLPGTKLGIEKLFSQLELSTTLANFRGCLLASREQIRSRGLDYRSQPHREKSFYEYFELVFEALSNGNDYQERLQILFKGRRHSQQLREVQKFRINFAK